MTSVYFTLLSVLLLFFFFNDTATTEIYTLSLHDALPISTAASPSTPQRRGDVARSSTPPVPAAGPLTRRPELPDRTARSEEHTSELQSPCNLVCRLLLEKKKKNIKHTPPPTQW